MFASLAGGYSTAPLPGLPDRLGDAVRRRSSGEIDEAALAASRDETIRDLLAEQEQAGLAILSDGGARWADPFEPLIAGLIGIEPGEAAALPGGEAVTRPRIVDGIGRDAPVFLAAWQFAAAAAELPVKQVVPGPYTLARLADLGGRSRETVTLVLAELLNAELRDLAAAGCPFIQVDEGLAGSIGEDAAEWRLLRRAHERLLAGLSGSGAGGESTGGSSGVHLSLGVTGGTVSPGGHEAALALPYVSYLVDVLAGPDAWRFVDAVPAERGIVCGVADAARSALDEVEVMAWAMAWAAEGGRGSDRVGIAPNGSLAAMDRLAAKRKIERLGETVSIASMGPLQDVAEALDPEPNVSRMADLRQLAEAVAAARSAAG